jgi:hypothetical protein
MFIIINYQKYSSLKKCQAKVVKEVKEEKVEKSEVDGDAADPFAAGQPVPALSSPSAESCAFSKTPNPPTPA